MRDFVFRFLRVFRIEEYNYVVNLCINKIIKIFLLLYVCLILIYDINNDLIVYIKFFVYFYL